MRKGRAGFTLFELLAVLFLLSLLAALTLPSLLGKPGGIEARLCRDRLAADIKTARDTAVAKARPTRLVWEETRYSLDLGYGDPIERTLPAGFTLAFTGRAAGTELAFTADGATEGGSLTLWADGQAHLLRVKEDGDCAWQ